MRMHFVVVIAALSFILTGCSNTYAQPGDDFATYITQQCQANKDPAERRACLGRLGAYQHGQSQSTTNTQMPGVHCHTGGNITSCDSQ